MAKSADLPTCGVLLFQNRPRRAFLVLLDNHKEDLPKGRLERGEDELSGALREMQEETGIHPSAVRVVADCRIVVDAGKGRRPWIVFVAEAEGPLHVNAVDHEDYAWIPWDPQHHLAAIHKEPRIVQALMKWEAHLQKVRHAAR